jgi:hypothetical protein
MALTCNPAVDASVFEADARRLRIDDRMPLMQLAVAGYQRRD